MASKSCPECGKSMEGMDIKAHGLSHWPDAATTLHEYSPEIQKRYKMLISKGGGE